MTDSKATPHHLPCEDLSSASSWAKKGQTPSKPPLLPFPWYGMEYFFGQFGSSDCMCSLLPLAQPHVYSLEGGVRNRGSLDTASTARQQLKHQCTINMAVVTNLKHNTIRTTVKKINSVQARHSTKSHFRLSVCIKYKAWCLLLKWEVVVPDVTLGKQALFLPPAIR